MTIEQQLANFLVYLVSVWVGTLQVYWWVPGPAFAALSLLAWLARETRFVRPFAVTALWLVIAQPGIFFALPHFSQYLFGQKYVLSNLHLWSFVLGASLVFLFVWLFSRYAGSVWDMLKSAMTRTSALERNRRTDIRNISPHLPNPQHRYDPRDYFDLKKGLFLGLDERKRPKYVELEKWQKSNVDIVGTTGCGKGVAAAVLLSQALKAGESVIAIDPKSDEFLPHVLFDAAKVAGVEYVYIDLLSDAPQWNPLQSKSEHEIEELFSAGFALGEKGTDADFYRLDDRRAARTAASLVGSGQVTLTTALRLLLESHSEIAEAGKKFVSDLEEISLVAATNVGVGVDIAGLIQRGTVIYVRGSMRNPRILKLQRIFLLSAIQHIEARPRDRARHTCIFMDEFKYLISRPALEALGAIRDKRAHVILAHQSLGDLRDCPADIDPESVGASVNENCAIKITYAVKDPDTAQWLSRMSGSILVDDEVRQIKTNAGLAEVRENARSLRQAERNLIDTNMLQALPDRCAVLFGVGLASYFFTSPIPVNKKHLATTPVQFKSNSSIDAVSTEMYAPLTAAQALLDVD